MIVVKKITAGGNVVQLPAAAQTHQGTGGLLVTFGKDTTIKKGEKLLIVKTGE